MLYSSRILDHPGILCKAIRESRRLLGIRPWLTTTEMARKCHIGERRIQQFENGECMLSDDVLQAYIDALGLPAPEALRLLMLCHSYRKREDYEKILYYRHLDVMLQHPRLRTAVEELRRQPYPALLLDPLSYVVAMNDLYVQLFNLDTAALLSPYIWHLIGAEFWSDSPVSRAQLQPRVPYLTHLVRLFNDTMVSFYFAQQNRSQQKSLLMLSPQGYGAAWAAWALMLQTDDHEEPVRVLRYREQVSYWRVQLYQPMMVPVDKKEHHLLPYRLLALVPASHDALIALGYLQAHFQRSVVIASHYGVSELILPTGLGGR